MTKIRRSLILLVMLAVALIGSRPLMTFAQQDAPIVTDVVLNFVEAVPDDERNELELRVFFTPVDASRRAVNNVTADGATFELEEVDGGIIEGVEVEKATGPISVVLVLDASGTMRAEIPQVKQAAKQLVNSTPSNYKFAVIVFNDSVTVAQGFTEDKNQVVNAIDAIGTPPNGAGTCLRDALLQSVELLNQETTQGRQASILFTDSGIDEKANGQVCSTTPPERVIQRAQEVRVPIYSIGFISGANFAADEIRQFSESTGGILETGNNIATSFAVITDALNAQLVAHAFISPTEGERPVTVNIVLQNGQQMPAIETVFDSPRDFSFKPPTATPTLPPISLTLNPPGFDRETKELLITMIVEGEEQIGVYRIDLVREDGTLETTVNVPAPREEPIRIPIGDVVGRYTVRVSALDFDGRLLGDPVETEGQFSPTATPTFTTTPSPQPISVTLDPVQYEDRVSKDNIIARVRLLGKEQIDILEFSLIDAESNTLQKTYDPVQVTDDTPNVFDVVLSMEDLPNAEYKLVVGGTRKDGEFLVTSAQNFRHEIPATATPTFTPSVTAVVVRADIQNVAPDLAANEYVIEIRPLNEELISAYRLEISSKETNLLIKTYDVEVPPYDTVRIPMADIGFGGFVAKLVVFGQNGDVVYEMQRDFEIIAPTATPTETPAPTATPMPDDLFSRIGRGFDDPSTRPIVLVVLGGIFLGFIGVMVAIVRRPKKPATGTPMLREMTGAVNIAELHGYMQQQGVQPPPAQGNLPRTGNLGNQAGNTPTMPPPSRQAPGQSAGDDRTNALPIAAMMPSATLFVEQSRDVSMNSTSHLLNRTPFTLGRRNRDLTVLNDDNVSREHAEITFENGAFYIRDNNSTHGTYVNGERVQPGGKRAIPDGAEIRLGTTTIMRFKMNPGGMNPGGFSGGYGGDVDKTRPF